MAEGGVGGILFVIVVDTVCSFVNIVFHRSESGT